MADGAFPLQLNFIAGETHFAMIGWVKIGSWRGCIRRLRVPFLCSGWVLLGLYLLHRKQRVLRIMTCSTRLWKIQRLPERKQ